MSTFREIAIKNAVRLIEWVDETVRSLEAKFLEVEKDEKKARERSEEYGSSIRTRARTFPELMESSGIIAAYTYMYAKATDEAYKKVCSLIDQGKPTLDPSIGKEEFGYAMLLHGILQFLENIGIVRDHRKPGEAIKELWSLEKTILASRLLLPYLMEVKKLSEAIFKGE
ncbi:MAG: type III-B CRISPR module-associated protein Cmr5 [Candidatus Brockarchaeota archaeon]|nr:type III-B CRISPR module-associated protein Cmr5 [Candidatus Brockarchaeota archaeon]